MSLNKTACVTKKSSSRTLEYNQYYVGMEGLRAL